MSSSVSNSTQLRRFLLAVLPERLSQSKDPRLHHIMTKKDFMDDVDAGVKKAPMSNRLTPHILSSIDWNNALDDPIRRQFISLGSSLLVDHPQLTLDSLHEEHDSRKYFLKSPAAC